MNSYFGKVLLLAIVIIEVLIVAYLFNSVFGPGISGMFARPNIIVVPISNYIYSSYSNITDDDFHLNYFRTLRPNVYYIENSTSYGTVVISTNVDGLRERYNYSREKPSNVFRIAFFGDSFTFGIENNITDVYTELLEGRLNSINCSKKFEVINFGIPGNDITYDSVLFKLKGKYYDADVNIFLLKGDDIRNIVDLRRFLFFKYLESYGWSDIELNESMEETVNLASIKEYSSILTDSLSQEHVSKAVGLINRENDGNSQIMFFTFRISDNYNKLLENATSKFGFTFVSFNDIDRLWDEKFSLIPGGEDPHPNKLGHQFLADYFYTYLLTNNLIDC